MNILIASAAPFSGLDHCFPLLQQAGLAAALPAASPAGSIGAKDWHTRLLAAQGVTGQLQTPSARLTVGKMWEELAVNLLLSNMNQPEWGLADERATWVLPFWASLDPQTRFALGHVPLGQAVALYRQHQPEGTDEGIHTLAQAWVAWNTELLAFAQKMGSRAVLFSLTEAMQHPLRLAHTCCKTLGLQQLDWQKLENHAVQAWPEAEDISVLRLPNLGAVRALQKKLDAATTLLLNPNTQVMAAGAPDKDLGWLPFGLFGKSKQLSQELRQTQFDLQKNQAELAQAHEHLADLQTLHEQILAEQKRQTFQAAEDISAEKLKAQLAVKEQQQEGELLLQQLHQVQEELEQIFLNREDLKKQLQTVEKAKTDAQAKVSELDKKTKDLDVKVKDLDAAKAKTDAANAELSKAKAESDKKAADAQTKASAAEKKATELDKAKAESDKKAAEAQTKASAAVKKADELDKAKTESDKKAAEAQTKASAAEKRAADLDKAKTESDKKAAEAQTKASAAEMKAAGLDKAKAESDKKAAEAQTKASAAEQKATELDKAKAESDKKAADAQTKASAAEKKAAELDKAKAESDKKAAEAQTKASAAEKRAADLDKAKTESDKKAAEAQTKASAAEKKAAELDKAKAEADKNAAEAQTKASAAEKKATELDKAKAEADKKAAEAQTKASAAEKKATDLAAQLQSASANLPQQTKALQEAQQENDLLLKQLHQVQEELESYFLKNKETDNKRSQLQERLDRVLTRLTSWADAELINTTEIVNENNHRCLRLDVQNLWVGQDAPVPKLSLLLGSRDGVPYMEFRPAGKDGMGGAARSLLPWPEEFKDEQGDRLLIAPGAPGAFGKAQAKVISGLSASQWRLVKGLLVLMGSQVNRLNLREQSERMHWVNITRDLTQQLDAVSTGVHFESAEVMAVTQPDAGTEVVRVAIRDLSSRNTRVPLCVFELGIKYKTLKSGPSPEMFFMDFRPWKGAVLPFVNFRPNSQDEQGEFLRVSMTRAGRNKNKLNVIELDVQDRHVVGQMGSVLRKIASDQMLKRFATALGQEFWTQELVHVGKVLHNSAHDQDVM